MKKGWIVLFSFIFIILVLFYGYSTTKSMEVDPNDIDLDITTINNYENSTIEINVSWKWNERPFLTLKDAIVITWDKDLFSLVTDSYNVESYYYKSDKKILCDKNLGLANISPYGITSHFNVCSGNQITGNMTLTLRAKDNIELSTTEIYAKYVHNYFGNMNTRPIKHMNVETTGKFFGEFDITKKIEW